MFFLFMSVKIYFNINERNRNRYKELNYYWKNVKFYFSAS